MSRSFARLRAMLLRLTLLQCSIVNSPACAKVGPEEPTLVKPGGALQVGDRAPNLPEAIAVGAPGAALTRGSRHFARLVRCDDPRILFKDEEQTRADRIMTSRLRARLVRLSQLVQRRWPGMRLRVTEAWDENREHGQNSVHYEGRAADVTTSDMDPAKLGQLARLAVAADFDWVFFENPRHVHVSVRK
jgi:hypothetical protein